MTEKKGSLSVREAGKLGGDKCKELYGVEFYSRIGAEGGAKTMARYGPAHYVKTGKLGGDVTAMKHGHAFYKRIGSAGGKRVRNLVEKGKQLERDQ